MDRRACRQVLFALSVAVCVGTGLLGCSPPLACDAVGGSCLDLTVEGEGEYGELSIELVGKGGKGAVVAKRGRAAVAATLPLHLELLPAPGIPEADVTYVMVQGSRTDAGVDKGGIDILWPPGQRIAARVVLKGAGASIHDVVPANGPVQGGTPIELSGEDFTADAVVRFGGVAAREVTVISPSRLFVTLPASMSGASAVPVSITTPDGHGTRWPGSFRYETPLPPVVQFGNQNLGIKALDNPTSLAIGDFDGDGKPDVVVASYSNSTVNLMRDDGLGGFVFLGPYAVGQRPRSIAVGDLRAEFGAGRYVDMLASRILASCRSAERIWRPGIRKRFAAGGLRSTLRISCLHSLVLWFAASVFWRRSVRARLGVRRCF